MKLNKYYIPPPRIEMDNYSYYGDTSYSAYNYLKPGIVSYIKTRRFELSLKMTKEYFGQNVIDFGCGDGPFLPSLSKHFNHVLALDIDSKFLDICKKIKQKKKLNNIILYNNKNKQFSKIKREFQNIKFKIAFLLGVLEHYGEKDSQYKSRIRLLKDIFSLLEKDGLILSD
jgi:2-polyprenyl-3-methyl-5-hydroxy-6-metoxy-1,4-benzoquinol methylase